VSWSLQSLFLIFVYFYFCAKWKKKRTNVTILFISYTYDTFFDMFKTPAIAFILGRINMRSDSRINFLQMELVNTAKRHKKRWTKVKMFRHWIIHIVVLFVILMGEVVPVPPSLTVIDEHDIRLLHVCQTDKARLGPRVAKKHLKGTWNNRFKVWFIHCRLCHIYYLLF